MLLLISLLAYTHLALAQTQYVVTNKCPSSINLYINGNLDSTLATGISTTKTLGGDTGLFYTDANGGSQNGVGSTRAGFYGDKYYYYIFKDPNHFNTAITISPRFTANNGFCVKATCDTSSCSTAFSQPPTALPAPQCGVPPAAPVYSCPYTNIIYDITFCPGGTFPPTGSALHPNGNLNKCLDVQAAVYANGTPVQIYDCNGTGAQKWVLSKGSTKVHVAGTNYCLDAGFAPANGVAMKIWQCYDNLAAQQWVYGNDNKITLEGKGQCLDLESGNTKNGGKVQTWECSAGNNNQVWTK